MIPFAGFGRKIVYAIFMGQGACALIRPGDIAEITVERAARALARHRTLLEGRIIDTEPVSLVARRDHPLMGRAKINPIDLLDFDWVMPGPEFLLTRAVLARLSAYGLPHPPQRLSTASFLLTLALLQQSNAIAPVATAVANSFAGTPDAPYAKVPVDLGIEVEPFCLITRASMALTPVAQQLADQIMAHQA